MAKIKSTGRSKVFSTNNYIFVGDARYDFYGRFLYRQGADFTANKMRKQGYNARVLPRKAQYGNTDYYVYARRRKV